MSEQKEYEQKHRKKLAYIWLCWLGLIAGAVIGFLWNKASNGDILTEIFAAIVMGIAGLLLVWILTLFWVGIRKLLLPAPASEQELPDS